MSPEMLAKFPDDCKCLLTMSVMQDPVICDDNISYERSAIEEWLSNHDTSPMTRKQISDKLIDNIALRNLIDDIKGKIEKDTGS